MTKDYNWLPFEEARKIVHKSRLKSRSEWIQFTRTSQFPDRIPKCPEAVYLDRGWVSWQHWLGYDFPQKSKRKKWRPYSEAKIFSNSLNLTSLPQWKEYIRNNKIPDDIPRTPERTYKNYGWVSWMDWLGYEIPLHMQKQAWLPYEEARKIIHKLAFQSQKEWRRYSKTSSRPHNIPANPDAIYRDQGWVNWQHWLGYKEMNKHMPHEWLPYEEAKKFIHTLGLKSQHEWQVYLRNNQLPPGIPRDPYHVYEGLNMYDWLGYKPKEWLPYKEARKYSRSLKLKNCNEWYKHAKTCKNFPDNIPHSARNFYKDKGWKGWEDWLGRPKKYILFKSARRKVRKMGIESEDEWFDLCKKDQIPDNIPVNPQIVYEKEGWKGWEDWLYRK